MLGSRVLPHVALYAVIVVTVSCSSDVSAPGVAPTTLAVSSGDAQAGIMAAKLAEPLAVRVTGLDLQPVPNVQVTFTVTSGGGSVGHSLATTDANGIATTSWTLGSGAGATRQSVAARFVGFSGPTVRFSANAGAVVTKVQGDSQAGEVLEVLAQDPAVVVHDALGVPVEGITIRWGVLAGRGIVSTGESVSDAAGYASSSWTLGPTVGVNAQTLQAYLPYSGLTTFAASATLTSGRLSILSGNNQAAFVGRELAERPAVRVTAGQVIDMPVAGVEVHWQVDAGGGVTVAATTTTDRHGVAEAEWALGMAVGVNSHRLSASVPGLDAPAVTFQASAIPVPASIVKIGGDLQTAPLGATLPLPLVVRVLDTGGDPIPDARVEWDHGYITLDDWFAKHAIHWSTTDAAGEASLLLTLKGEIAADSMEAVRAYVVGAKEVVAIFYLNVLQVPIGPVRAAAGEQQ